MENPRAAAAILLQAPPGPRACQHLRRRATPRQGGARCRRQGARRGRQGEDAVEPRHLNEPAEGQVQEAGSQEAEGCCCWAGPAKEKGPVQRSPAQGENLTRGSEES